MEEERLFQFFLNLPLETSYINVIHVDLALACPLFNLSLHVSKVFPRYFRTKISKSVTFYLTKIKYLGH